MEVSQKLFTNETLKANNRVVLANKLNDSLQIKSFSDQKTFHQLMTFESFQ